MLHTECLGWAEDGKEVRGFFLLLKIYLQHAKPLKKKFYLFQLYWVFAATGAFLQLQRAGTTLVVVHGLLTEVASLVEHRLQGVKASATAVCGLSSCSSHALQSTGSTVVVHRPSCSVACQIFLDQGLNLYLLHWQADSLSLSHQENPEVRFLSTGKLHTLHKMGELYTSHLGMQLKSPAARGLN